MSVEYSILVRGSITNIAGQIIEPGDDVVFMTKHCATINYYTGTFTGFFCGERNVYRCQNIDGQFRLVRQKKFDVAYAYRVDNVKGVLGFDKPLKNHSIIKEGRLFKITRPEIDVSNIDSKRRYFGR